MQTRRVKWSVSLANGETFFEEKGAFQTLPGAPSPWQRLLAYCTTHHLTITSLSLYTDEGQTFHLPSNGTNPKFHAFHQAAKPLSYNFYRVVGHDIYDKVFDHFAVIEAIYDSYRLQIWVNENDPKHSWVLVQK